MIFVSFKTVQYPSLLDFKDNISLLRDMRLSTCWSPAFRHPLLLRPLSLPFLW